MDSSDSLQLDENLARFLAAFDQGIDGGDAGAPTMHVPYPRPAAGDITTDRQLTPQPASNEGSMGEVLPDSGRLARPPAAAQPPTGTHRIGRFELRRQLGKGGCGIVFLAYDPKLRREVALKVPRPEMLMNPDAKRRLKLEALAASEFDHPNLVPVYEWGEVGPICFIATAFCPGQTLAEWLDRQAFPVPVRQAARVVATVADAVQHAHDHGVLHRDLKPNNVILQEMKVEENDEPPAGSVQLRGDYYVPRIVDFGLAKVAERGGPSETGTRQILGTPKYMAPEQAQARREDIGPPADVYALGVVLYEMLAGRAPYDGASDVEVLRQSVEGRPTQPRSLRPDLPRDLEAICLKAMARTTAERYRTAIDLADDLRRFLDGRPTVARPLAWSGRAIRWLRRNDQLVAIAVLAVVTLAVTAMATWNSYRTRHLRNERDTAVGREADRDRTDRQREYARQVQIAYAAWRGGNTVAAADALDAAQRTATALGEWPDFAHAYLAKLVRAERLMIVCPAGAVTALAVSPDGARLASGHADGMLAVWDRATGKPLGGVKAHESEVTHVTFGPTGKLVFTLAAGSPVRGWSADVGTIVPAPEPHRSLGKDITCLTCAPGGSVLFAGDAAGAVHRFDLADAKGSRTVAPGKGDQATAIACSPDGAWLLLGTAKGKVHRLSPAPTGGEFDAGGPVTALAVSAKGVCQVGLRDGSRQYSFATHPVRAYPVSTGDCVHWIASAGPGAAFNTAAGRVRVGLLGRDELTTGDAGLVRAGVFAPDGNTLFTAGVDGVIRSWQPTADVAGRGTVAVADGLTAVGVHPTAARFTLASHFELTPFENGAAGKPLDGSSGRAYRAACLLDDGSCRAVTFDGRAAVVLQFAAKPAPKREERFRTVPANGRAPTAAALTFDGATLAVGDDGGTVWVWPVAGGPAVTVDTGHAPVREVVLSDDGKVVAARTATGVGVWPLAAPEVGWVVPADDQAAFRFVGTGGRVAVAGRDGVVRVYSAGREELALFGHVGRVTALGVSPDGRTLVSGCATGEVKFWDLRTGQELFGVRRHSAPVTVIEFAADGRYLVTGSSGQVAVWDGRAE